MTRVSRAVLQQLAEAELPPQVKAVGITRHNGQLALLVLTQADGGPTAFAASELLPRGLQGFPLVLRDVPGRLHAAAYLPSTQSEALTPEQGVLEPLVLGAQVQNGSADERLGGYGVGTLGAFAQDADGQVFALSNNHVIAAENDAREGNEIYQAQRGRGRVVASLSAWVPLTVEAPNRVDIASARLTEETAFENGFLPLRQRPALSGVTTPKVGARVFKVGRTSGLTLGSVTAVETRVPNVDYGIGSASFAGSFIIEGQGGSTFSAPGDSGSGIYDLRGRLLGFLYAGDGTITLACPAQEALDALSLQLLTQGALAL